MLTEEMKHNKEFRKDVLEGDELIRKEIKDLHDQIAERDALLCQVSQNPDISSDIKAMIQESQEQLMEKQREVQETSENPLLKRFLMGDGDLDLVPTQDSCYLTPSDVQKIVEKQREKATLLSKKKKKVSKLKKENKALQEKLSSSAGVGPDDLEVMIDLKADDKLEEIKEEYQNEKDVIMKSLKDRVQKVLDLEMEVDLQQEEYAKLHRFVEQDETGNMKMLLEYERNIESLNRMYQESSNKAASMKVELKVTNKKIKSLTKKLDKAKDELDKKKKENKSLRNIAGKLRDAVENENYVQNRGTFSHTTGKGIRKVVKKIKR